MNNQMGSPAETQPGQAVDDGKRLYDILQMGSEPETIRREAFEFLTRSMPDMPLEQVEDAFQTMLDLYAGDYPGYRACNTGYHDLRHILETFLAMARLLHGALLEGKIADRAYGPISLMASLFHDAGYIQHQRDTGGTGAKYTDTHVGRSADFFASYGKQIGMSEADVDAARLMIRCTDLGEDISALEFPASDVRFLGEMLNVADLWAQMADRVYLEKLFYLFSEFDEGKSGLYQNQVDLLRKTIGFYHLIRERFKNAIDQADALMVRHFEDRWQIPENLYRVAIRKHKDYLMKIVQLPEVDLLRKLKRNGVVREATDSTETSF